MCARSHSDVSNAFLNQIEFACRQAKGKLTISVDHSDGWNRFEVSFKRPGRHAETVSSHGTKTSLDDVLSELLYRLGLTAEPTPENLIEQATPAQRARLEAALQKVMAIKRDILAWGARSEPRLAPPRGSLNPGVLQGVDGLCVEDDDDLSERAREAWRARRAKAGA